LRRHPVLDKSHEGVPCPLDGSIIDDLDQVGAADLLRFPGQPLLDCTGILPATLAQPCGKDVGRRGNLDDQHARVALASRCNDAAGHVDDDSGTSRDCVVDRSRDSIEQAVGLPMQGEIAAASMD
jgi:hypothetical protein